MGTAFDFLRENLYFLSIGLIFPLLGFLVDARTMIDLIKGNRVEKISSSKNFIGSSSFDAKSFSCGATAGVAAGYTVLRPDADLGGVNGFQNTEGRGRMAASASDEILDDFDDDVLNVNMSSADDVVVSSDFISEILDLF